MNCYNCGCQLSEEDFCTNCGADVGLYKKIMMTSNSFYNEGLEKASVRDLSGAVISLRQSLKFNKNNIAARNLLGLVYYELGEVVAALSEWVISKNMRHQKNIADEYITMIQDNPSRLESINQTIKKYNQALLYCTQDSKDLAVIQLKAVLSMNPKFIRAHQLLALLYIDMEEAKKAQRELIKCQQIDVGNTVTQRYLKEVEEMLRAGEEALPKKTLSMRNKEDAEETIRFQRDNELIIQPFSELKEAKGVSISSLVYVVIGLAIGIAITFFLILPARIQNAISSASEQVKSVSEEMSTKTSDMDDLEQELSTLQESNDELQAELDDYVGTNGTIQVEDELLSAVNSYLTDPSDTATVAAAIEEIQTETTVDENSEAFQDVYNTLVSIIGPEVVEEYYNEGMEAYNTEDYTTAITDLKKAIIYESDNADIVYELANAYYRSGDDDSAATYYQQVITDFAGTQQAEDAQSALDDMGIDSASSASSESSSSNSED